MGHTVFAGPTGDMSSMISNDGSQFWLGKEDVSDVGLCLLRSFGPGSTEQSTRRISMLEHMEIANTVCPMFWAASMSSVLFLLGFEP